MGQLRGRRAADAPGGGFRFQHNVAPIRLLRVFQHGQGSQDREVREEHARRGQRRTGVGLGVGPHVRARRQCHARPAAAGKTAPVAARDDLKPWTDDDSRLYPVLKGTAG
jgi:hypothetical protein